MGKIKKAELLYTKGSEEIWPDKKWDAIPVEINGQSITSQIPEGSVAVYFNLTDEDDMMVSSEFIEVK